MRSATRRDPCQASFTVWPQSAETMTDDGKAIQSPPFVLPSKEIALLSCLHLHAAGLGKTQPVVIQLSRIVAGRLSETSVHVGGCHPNERSLLVSLVGPLMAAAVA